MSIVDAIERGIELATTTPDYRVARQKTKIYFEAISRLAPHYPDGALDFTSHTLARRLSNHMEQYSRGKLLEVVGFDSDAPLSVRAINGDIKKGLVIASVGTADQKSLRLFFNSRNLAIKDAGFLLSSEATPEIALLPKTDSVDRQKALQGVMEGIRDDVALQRQDFVNSILTERSAHAHLLAAVHPSAPAAVDQVVSWIDAAHSGREFVVIGQAPQPEGTDRVVRLHTTLPINHQNTFIGLALEKRSTAEHLDSESKFGFINECNINSYPNENGTIYVSYPNLGFSIELANFFQAIRRPFEEFKAMGGESRAYRVNRSRPQDDESSMDWFESEFASYMRGKKDIDMGMLPLDAKFVLLLRRSTRNTPFKNNLVFDTSLESAVISNRKEPVTV